jgi:ATP-dependent Clp protease protease subunit
MKNNVEDLYDGEINSNEVFKEETYVVKTKDVESDIPVRWKEATTQMDYGIDVEASTILLFGEIMDGSLYDIITRIRAILHMRKDENKKDPINLIINSDGGSVYESLGIIDYMQSLDVKVNTICRGRAMSAAALILCAGTGVRAASQYSTIMFHEISSDIYGKSSDMKANVQHMEKLEEILLGILKSNSNKDIEFWKNVTIKDYYITPTDALNLGVIDTIIQPKHKRG